MKSTPRATTWRKSAMAALASGGSPHAPRPVMRIAPKPIRATVRSPPMVIVPASCRRLVAGVIANLLILCEPFGAGPHFCAGRGDLVAKFSAGLCGDDRSVDFRRQHRHMLGQRLDRFGNFGVLPHHLKQQRLLLGRLSHSLLTGTMEILAMLGVGDGVHLVPVGLSRLRQKNERCRIGSLQAESEIEQDEGIKVEVDKADDIEDDPDGNEDGLADQKDRGSEKAGKVLRLEGEPVVAENRAEMQMRLMKSVKM